jgi:hypothetical protein
VLDVESSIEKTGSMGIAGEGDDRGDGTDRITGIDRPVPPSAVRRCRPAAEFSSTMSLSNTTPGALPARAQALLLCAVSPPIG